MSSIINLPTYEQVDDVKKIVENLEVNNKTPSGDTVLDLGGEKYKPKIVKEYVPTHGIDSLYEFPKFAVTEDFVFIRMDNNSSFKVFNKKTKSLTGSSSSLINTLSSYYVPSIHDGKNNIIYNNRSFVQFGDVLYSYARGTDGYGYAISIDVSSLEDMETAPTSITERRLLNSVIIARLLKTKKYILYYPTGATTGNMYYLQGGEKVEKSLFRSVATNIAINNTYLSSISGIIDGGEESGEVAIVTAHTPTSGAYLVKYNFVTKAVLSYVSVDSTTISAFSDGVIYEDDDYLVAALYNKVYRLNKLTLAIESTGVIAASFRTQSAGSYKLISMNENEVIVSGTSIDNVNINATNPMYSEYVRVYTSKCYFNKKSSITELSALINTEYLRINTSGGGTFISFRFDPYDDYIYTLGNDGKHILSPVNKIIGYEEVL